MLGLECGVRRGCPGKPRKGSVCGVCPLPFCKLHGAMPKGVGPRCIDHIANLPREEVKPVLTPRQQHWAGAEEAPEKTPEPCDPTGGGDQAGSSKDTKEVISNPALHVTREMEDFITWSQGSKIKRKVEEFKDEADDYALLGN